MPDALIVPLRYDARKLQPHHLGTENRKRRKACLLNRSCQGCTNIWEFNKKAVGKNCDIENPSLCLFQEIS